MSAKEREIRSRITQIMRDHGVLRGSLLERKVRCGNKGCRCRTKDERHESLALQISIEGRSRQFHVPKAMQPEVRAWVSNYQEVRRLLDELGRLYLERMSTKRS